MQQEPTFLEFLRKLFLLALLGLAAIFLSGPILAIASVLLSVGLVVGTFAAIGLAVWIPIQMLVSGREAALSGLKQFARTVSSQIGWLARSVAQVLAFLPRAAGAVARSLIQLPIWGIKTVFRVTRFVGEIGVVAASGAAVGVLYALATADIPDQILPVAATIGAMLAAGVGLVMSVFEKRSPARPSTKPSPVPEASPAMAVA